MISSFNPLFDNTSESNINDTSESNSNDTSESNSNDTSESNINDTSESNSNDTIYYSSNQLDNDTIISDINSLMSNISISDKEEIIVYDKENELINICKKFINEEIKIYAECMNKKIKITNINLIGDIFEDILYNKICETINDFEEGPKQSSPDFYAFNKKYEYELKTFTKNPNFDISNYASYIDQLCENNGVYRKVFRTKYLIFEYIFIDNKIFIKNFDILNVYNIVSESNKYSINMQVKRKIWYNIRPSSKKSWYLSNKTPDLFIKNIIQSIKDCPNIDNKEIKIQNIEEQYKNIKLKYNI